MVRGVKANFSRNNNDLLCPLKCSTQHVDSQENMLFCSTLRNKIDSKYIKHSDLFIANVNIQCEAVKIYSLLLTERTRLLEADLSADADPLH